MYREWSYPLDGAVIWTRGDLSAPDGAVHRILPDGCMDLIWFDGSLMVAGPDTRAFVSRVGSAREYVAVRFRPGQAPAVLGLPADEVRDRRPDLDGIWPAAEVRELSERIGSATDRPAALAAEVARRLRRAGPPDPLTRTVAGRLRRGHSVTAVADAVGLGPRALHRVSLHAFGYGPKTLAKVLRFNRALALARTGVAFAEVAAATGYADQAHLSRDVRQLAGVPLTDLVRPAR
jgi:AraC-like DNA-binding protein